MAGGPRYGRESLSVLLKAGGDVGIQHFLLTGFQGGGAAVAGVCDQGTRRCRVHLSQVQP